MQRLSWWGYTVRVDTVSLCLRRFLSHRPAVPLGGLRGFEEARCSGTFDEAQFNLRAT